MWLARAFVQLVTTTAIVFAIAVALAGLLALVLDGGYLRSLQITALSIGALLVLIGATGGMSSAFSRAADAEARMAGLGRLPGMPSWAETRDGDVTLSGGAVFVTSGLALIALGLVVG
jgi:hypothetical protein